MGKYSKGILGAFSGKVGTVIGSSWRGIDYMRSLPRFKKNRLASAAQLEQQVRFGLMTQFLSPVRPLLEESFKNAAIRQTGYNAALSYNVRNGISGTYPDLAIDYAMVCISRGDLVGVSGLAIETSPGAMTLRWEDNSTQGSAQPTDQAIVLIYCPELKESAYFIGDAVRSGLTMTPSIPSYFQGKMVHVWITFKSANENNVAISTYTGPVTV